MIIRGGNEKSIGVDASACGNVVKFLEHLYLNIDATGGTRGNLSVLVRSPEGTESTLLGPRPKDSTATGLEKFSKWPMMSLHFWGKPVVSKIYGSVWTLTIKNIGSSPCTLNDWGLTFYGTSRDPQPGTSIKPSFKALPKRPLVAKERLGSKGPSVASKQHAAVLKEGSKLSVDDFLKLL